MLELKPQPRHSVAVIFWASQLTYLDIDFLICKIGGAGVGVGEREWGEGENPAFYRFVGSIKAQCT